MATIAIELPDEVFPASHRSPAEFAKHMRLAAAMYWYARGEISMEKAALIAGMDRTDFLQTLATERIEVFAVDMASLQRELDRD